MDGSPAADARPLFSDLQKYIGPRSEMLTIRPAVVCLLVLLPGPLCAAAERNDSKRPTVLTRPASALGTSAMTANVEPSEIPVTISSARAISMWTWLTSPPPNRPAAP